MRTRARVLKYLGFAVVVLVGVAGAVFAAGYAFEDLEPVLAASLTAAWVAPMTALSVIAARSPQSSAPWLVALTAIAVVLAPVVTYLDLVPEEAGPAVTIGLLALAVPAAFLGLHQATTSGLMLVMLAAGQLGAAVAGRLASSDTVAIGGLFDGSSGVTVLPLLLGGILFLAFGLSVRERPAR